MNMTEYQQVKDLTYLEYSGWQTKQEWRRKCHERVIDDKEIYFELLKQLISTIREKCIEQLIVSLNTSIPKMLCRSSNEGFDSWDCKKNNNLYKEIKKLL